MNRSFFRAQEVEYKDITEAIKQIFSIKSREKDPYVLLSKLEKEYRINKPTSPEEDPWEDYNFSITTANRYHGVLGIKRLLQACRDYSATLEFEFKQVETEYCDYLLRTTAHQETKGEPIVINHYTTPILLLLFGRHGKMFGGKIYIEERVSVL